MDTEHVHVDKQSPAAYKSLVGVSTADRGRWRPRTRACPARSSSWSTSGCRSSTAARRAWRSTTARPSRQGVTDKQLATLSVWRDTELFDERERAALRLAEITTTLPDHDTADREYARAQKESHRRRAVGGDLGGDRDQRVQPGVDPQPPPVRP